MQKARKTEQCSDCKEWFESHQIHETMDHCKVCIGCAIILCHDCGAEVSSFSNPTCPNCGPRFVRPYVIGGNNLGEKERAEEIKLARKKIVGLLIQNSGFRLQSSSDSEITSRV